MKKQPTRNRKGQFLRGVSGNLSGRPRNLRPGAWLRRKLTARGLANIVYQQVKAGNPSAMKLALEMITSEPAEQRAPEPQQYDLSKLSLDELLVFQQLLKKLEGQPVEDALAAIRPKAPVQPPNA